MYRKLRLLLLFAIMSFTSIAQINDVLLHLPPAVEVYIKAYGFPPERLTDLIEFEERSGMTSELRSIQGEVDVWFVVNCTSYSIILDNQEIYYRGFEARNGIFWDGSASYERGVVRAKLDMLCLWTKDLYPEAFTFDNEDTCVSRNGYMTVYRADDNLPFEWTSSVFDANEEWLRFFMEKIQVNFQNELTDSIVIRVANWGESAEDQICNFSFNILHETVPFDVLDCDENGILVSIYDEWDGDISLLVEGQSDVKNENPTIRPLLSYHQYFDGTAYAEDEAAQRQPETKVAVSKTPFVQFTLLYSEISLSTCYYEAYYPVEVDGQLTYLRLVIRKGDCELAETYSDFEEKVHLLER